MPQEMPHGAKWTIITIGIICVFVIGCWGSIRVIGTLTPAPLEGTTHGELLTTLLTGLGIAIAVLAIVIAAMAIFGYSAIRKEAKTLARKQSQTSAVQYLKSPEVKNLIRSEVQRIIKEELAETNEGLGMAAAFTAGIAGGATMEEAAGPAKPLGKRKPKSETESEKP